MHHNPHPRSLPWALAALTLASLGACGGGGATTGPLIQPPPTDVVSTPSPVPDSSPDATAGNGTTGTSLALVPVRVAIVDSGFKLDHPELDDLAYQAQEFAGTGTLEDNVMRHGTYVAQTLSGETVGATAHASLLLAKTADAQGHMYTDKILDATTWAVNNGARVVNFSLAPMFAFQSNDFLGQTYAAALGASGGLGAVVVLAAGNITPSGGSYNPAQGNISTQQYASSTFFGGNNAYNDISLIVGAIDSNGERQPYSKYPGGVAEVQSRFLVTVAPVTIQSATGGTPYTFNGTSATAPIVSAAAADVLYQWPHLTAQQVSSILLSTADTQFSNLYASYACGSASYSCGHYYFGQGKLDRNAALTQPIGTPVLLTGATVGDGGAPVGSTGLLLPSAFGDALAAQSLNTVMFDAYGRDFGLSLHRLLGASPNRLGQDWLAASGLQQRQYGDERNQVGLTFDAQGQLLATRLGLQWGERLRWSWQRGTGRGFDAQPTQDGPWLSWTGQEPLRAYAALDQLGVRWQLGRHSALQARSTFADNGALSQAGPAATAQRHEAAWVFEPDGATRWSLGYAITKENRALLGQSGQGALALDRTQAQALTMQFDRQLSAHWRLQGAAALGTLQVQGSTGYLDMDLAHTSEWRAGLAWSEPDGGAQVGLALSQPLRVERARAQFDLPVGRTLDGQVIRASQRLSVAPSGRQTNLELAYRRPWGGADGRQGTLGLNAIYAHDAGHVSGQRDWSLIGSYNRRW